jgi:hypothetical protein
MISKDKTYRTRDGREVRIYATDGGGDYPVHGAALGSDGWRQLMWLPSGKSYFENFDENPTDLIEVKPRVKRTVWLNVYENDLVASQTRVGADWCVKHHSRVAGLPRLACVKVEIDCEEGEGL